MYFFIILLFHNKKVWQYINLAVEILGENQHEIVSSMTQLNMR